MGGFAFSTDRTDPNFLPDSLTRLCLNPRGLIFLAKNAPHMLSDLPRNDILDKSKASGLAKFLVCVQAVWFCVQSINRMAQGYAISLLELNVFGQALCALFIYAFWWHKPLDIQEPTLIAQTEEAWELCALICVTNARYTKAFYNSDQDSSEIVEIYQPFAFLTPRPWHELLSGKLQFRKDEYNNTPRMRFVWNRKRIIVYGNSTSKIAEATCGTEQGSRRSTRLREGESIYGFHCQTLDSQFVYPSLWSDGAKPIWDLPHSKPTECILEPSDLRRLELCSKILRRNFLPGRNYWGSIKSLKPTAYTRIENRTSGEMRIPGAADGALGIVSLGVTIAGLAYGGLHLLAWNDPFSSRVEQILWRFSGLIIPAARPAMMVLDPTLDYLNAIEGIRREESSLLCSWGSA
ncbi:MAG: hypothetical protein L6R41_005906 [Letrouitia leprolyta]|nr:MAG: hypothetical protein L6R41_005906 [Letrouitia leprolyta]